MAEWLGSALQKLLQQFESVWYLRSRLPGFYFMLTPEEKAFVEYWSVERLKKPSFRKKLSSGLPLAVLIVLGVFVSFFIGWYKRATMIVRSHGSLILPVLLGAIGIVIFMSVFSARHQYDQNEENYQFLLKKQESEAAQGD
jgi:CHASE3 domain sensor protein